MNTTVTEMYQTIIEAEPSPDTSDLRYTTGKIVASNLAIVDDYITPEDVANWGPKQVYLYLEDIWGCEWNEEEQRWIVNA